MYYKIQVKYLNEKINANKIIIYRKEQQKYLNEIEKQFESCSLGRTKNAPL